MANYIIGLVLMVLIPLALIFIFTELDVEISETIRLKDIDLAVIILVAVGYWLITNTIFTFNTGRYVNMTIVMAYLVFMSYTDQKTKLLYSIVSVVMMVFELIWLAVSFKNLTFNKYDLLLIPVLIMFLLLSKFKWLGFGDVMIYMVLIIYELIFSYIPFWDILFNYTVANILFVVTSCVMKLVSKKKEVNDKHLKFTIYIAISTFLCNMVLI